jgi:hypothetical protein
MNHTLEPSGKEKADASIRVADRLYAKLAA